MLADISKRDSVFHPNGLSPNWRPLAAVRRFTAPARMAGSSFMKFPNSIPGRWLKLETPNGAPPNNNSRQKEGVVMMAASFLKSSLSNMPFPQTLDALMTSANLNWDVGRALVIDLGPASKTGKHDGAYARLDEVIAAAEEQHLPVIPSKNHLANVGSS
jgi:hypothetical protein